MIARAALSGIAGILFGFGLALSGMMDPARVRGFLDVFGAWDPTLAFVMGGAVCVMAGAWFVQRRLTVPLADTQFHVPETKSVDARLIAGAALFGIGWGLAGLCPGPALASVATALTSVVPFVAAMVAGMALFRIAGLDR